MSAAAACILALVVPPLTASAAPLGPRAVASSSSPCGRVSSAAVAAVVGHAVPKPLPLINRTVFNKTYGISAVVTDCIYGKITSLASLKTAVSIFYETLSKPISAAIFQKGLAAAEKKSATGGAKIKITTFNGLGVPAFLIVITSSVVSAEAIFAGRGGQIAGVEVTSKLSMNKLTALARLAVAGI